MSFFIDCFKACCIDCVWDCIKETAKIFYNSYLQPCARKICSCSSCCSPPPETPPPSLPALPTKSPTTLHAKTNSAGLSEELQELKTPSRPEKAIIDKLISRAAYCEYQSKLHNKLHRKYSRYSWFFKIFTFGSASLVFANSQLTSYIGTEMTVSLIVLNTILTAFIAVIDFGKKADSALSASEVFRHIYLDIFDEVASAEAGNSERKSFDLISLLKSTTKELNWLIQIYPDIFDFRDMGPSKPEEQDSSKKFRLQQELDEIQKEFQVKLRSATEEHRLMTRISQEAIPEGVLLSEGTMSEQHPDDKVEPLGVISDGTDTPEIKIEV